jgi:uncharacterized SAM-binding protein YcdF (DUF218 family)
MPSEVSGHPRSIDNDSKSNKTVPKLQWFAVLLFFVSALLVGGWLTGGKSGIEKTLARLVQPLTLFWMFFSVGCLLKTVHYGISETWKPWIVWFVFYLLTTSPLSEFCLRVLESDLKEFDPVAAGTLDNLVVLGGGTHQGPTRSELASDGDRVLFAAELYLQGHTKRLTTTGDASPGVSRDLTSPREQTLEIWQKLKIPSDAIDTIHGINTFEELKYLKENWDKIGGDKVGLLTSASHLPRALRLARARGLELIPVPADHDYTDLSMTYLDFIPSAGPLNQLAACQHEFMAWLVNR